MGVVRVSAFVVALCILPSIHAAAQAVNWPNCLKHLGGGGFGDFDCYGWQSKRLEGDNAKIVKKIWQVDGTTSADKASLDRYMRSQDEAVKSCDLAVDLSYSWKIDVPPKTHINMYDVMGAKCRYQIRKQQNEYLRDLYSIHTG
ncbi:exported hypothetical protein [Paraburkholderia unamae]|uniref:hypothetical protein n=1 Tax=Paraburkholderia unamae TaxID=219649 RepID=UPI001CB1B069|nr:hypothetical protein [Paraburkholderia unamae]CAG9265117.1 exported hypothetical protein [Paraburkholderia unamae]